MRRSPIGDRFRRLVRAACLVAIGIVLAAPLLLGPALAPIAHALAGEAKHLCACGMVQGTCGCPECELLTGATHHDAGDDDDMAAAPRPVLKSSCDDGAPTMPSFAGLPPTTLPRTSTLAPPLAQTPSPVLAVDALVARDRLRPPTPPPRSTRA